MATFDSAWATPRAKVRTFLELAAAILVAAPFAITADAPFPRAWPWLYPVLTLGVAVPLAVLGFRKAFSSGDSQVGESRFGIRETAFLVGFPLFALFIGNNRLLSSGDNEATRGFGLLVVHGTLDFGAAAGYQRDLPYAFTRSGGRILPAYPMGTAILALPHTLVAILAQGKRYTGLALLRDEKHCAALLVAIAACVLFGAVARIAHVRAAWATAAVFGLCTPALTSLSQGLWSSTGSVFFLVAALASLLISESRSGSIFGGASLAAAVLCRPTAALPASFIFIALLARSRSRALVAAAGFGVVLIAGVLGTSRLYGTLLGPYVAVTSSASSWRPGAEGIAGVLVSPSRGLILYMPFVLFAGVAARRAAQRKDRVSPLVFVSIASIGAEVLLAGLRRWWAGGHAIGPRLLAEVSPFLALSLLPLWTEKSLSRWPRRLFLAAVCWSGVVQIMGAFNPRAGEWNELLDSHPEVLWSIRNGQLAATLVPNWRSSIPKEPPGVEDARLTASLEAPAEDETVQGDIVVRGWGRIPGEDLDVAITIDGRLRAPKETRRFARPDVAAAVPSLGDASRAGFEIIIPMDPGEAGSHQIVAIFRSSDGRVRHFPFREFKWKP